MFGLLTTNNQKIQVYRASENARLPTKATPESIGLDLYSAEKLTLYPDSTIAISTDLIMKPPIGYHIKIYARSGWGSRYNIGIPHGCGLVDPDFCGPNDIIKVVLHRPARINDLYIYADMNKQGDIAADIRISNNVRPLQINIGDRIAQMALEASYNYIDFELLDEPPSGISRGGFGSTGIK